MHRRPDRPVRSQLEAVGVPQAPGHHLQVRAVRAGTEDGAVALRVARHGGSGAGRPIGRVGARLLALRIVAQRVLRVEHGVGEHDVAARHVVELASGLDPEPAEDRVVRPDHGGVRDRPDGEVHQAVLEHDLVRLVVALAGKAADDRAHGAVRFDHRDGAAVGGVDPPLVEGHRRERDLVAEVPPVGEDCAPPVRLEPGDPRVPATVVPGLGDQHPGLVVEGDHGRGGQVLDHRLDLEAARHTDVPRTDRSLVGATRQRQGSEKQDDDCRPAHRALRSCRTLSVAASGRRHTMCSAPLRGRCQNIPLSLAAIGGTTCSTSQCSTILPSSSSRKMSMPA